MGSWAGVIAYRLNEKRHVSLSVAVEAARATPYGFEPFNIVASDTLLDIPTEEAIRRVAPDTMIRSPLKGYGSAFDIGKAKRILGWEPWHSWRDVE